MYIFYAANNVARPSCLLAVYWLIFLPVHLILGLRLSLQQVGQVQFEQFELTVAVAQGIFYFSSDEHICNNNLLKHTAKVLETRIQRNVQHHYVVAALSQRLHCRRGDVASDTCQTVLQNEHSVLAQTFCPTPTVLTHTGPTELPVADPFPGGACHRDDVSHHDDVSHYDVVFRHDDRLRANSAPVSPPALHFPYVHLETLLSLRRTLPYRAARCNFLFFQPHQQTSPTAWRLRHILLSVPHRTWF